MGKVIFINERVEINMDNIRFQVDSIIEEYTDGSLPIDPVVIAKKVGIPISQVNFKSVKGSAVLGGIKKNKENRGRLLPEAGPKMRVISSPSISTRGVVILIFSMVLDLLELF